MLFGDSLRALRFFPALASGAKIFLKAGSCANLADAATRSAGGHGDALCPSTHHGQFPVMNAFEPVLWMLWRAIALRIIAQASNTSGCSSAWSQALEFE